MEHFSRYSQDNELKYLANGKEFNKLELQNIMRQFKNGEWVRRDDPTGEGSGLCRVLIPKNDEDTPITNHNIGDSKITVRYVSGLIVDVRIAELKYPSLRVIYRMEDDGADPQIFALFPDENPDGRAGIVLYYQSQHPNYLGAFNGCVNASVPAKPADYTPLLQELRSIGFKDLQVITYHDWIKGRINRFAQLLAERDLLEDNDQLQHQLYDSDANLREEYRDQFAESVRFYTSELALLCDCED